MGIFERWEHFDRSVAGRTGVGSGSVSGCGQLGGPCVEEMARVLELRFVGDKNWRTLVYIAMYNKCHSNSTRFAITREDRARALDLYTQNIAEGGKLRDKTVKRS